MQNLFVRKLYLWPRFQAVVVSVFDQCKVSRELPVDIHTSDEASTCWGFILVSPWPQAFSSMVRSYVPARANVLRPAGSAAL